MPKTTGPDASYDTEKTLNQLPEDVGASTIPSIEEKERQVPPDGGLDAWLCVLGAFFCQISSFGFVTA